jgi:hypothetical protein
VQVHYQKIFLVEKILAATGFSANSRATLRFSIRLVVQYTNEIAFVHCYHIMKPPSTSIIETTFEMK